VTVYEQFQSINCPFVPSHFTKSQWLQNLSVEEGKRLLADD